MKHTAEDFDRVTTFDVLPLGPRGKARIAQLRAEWFPETVKAKPKSRAAEKPERGTVQDAVFILGKESRTVRALAAKGKLPGAAKIEGTWTFDIGKLRAYVSSKELEVCQDARRRRPGVSGVTGRSMAGYKPAAGTSSGHFGQTIQRLREVAAKQSATER